LKFVVAQGKKVGYSLLAPEKRCKVHRAGYGVAFDKARNAYIPAK